MIDTADRRKITVEMNAAWKAGDRRAMNESAAILGDWYRDAGRDDLADLILHRVRCRRSANVRWPDPNSLDGLSFHQRQQWRYASASPFALLTGTPGTGKTYVAAHVARTLLAAGQGPLSVCAPTGKAAVRVTESMRKCGVEIQATTIHTLLEIGRNGHDGDGWGFRRNQDNPLPDRFVIVDEPSMLDADLAAALFRACSPGTHVLLAGDPYQLPPVGHGAPLRDLIAAGLPCGMLTEIKRNAGQIVQACARIKDGAMFEVTPASKWQPSTTNNLVHFATSNADAQVNRVLDLMGKAASASRLMREREVGEPGSAEDPLWQTQVLIATNKGSAVSRRELNRAIQARVNPAEPVEGNLFRHGDKIICLRNGWHLDDGTGFRDCYVANGEIGIVASAEPGLTRAQFSSPTRLVRIPMAKRRAQAEADGERADQGDEIDDGAAEAESGTGCDFDLGWAITVHKSQGSEWPTVLVVIDDSSSARRICSREWLYTAISRASAMCVLIGNLSAAQMMARRPALLSRKTFLRELLTEGV